MAIITAMSMVIPLTACADSRTTIPTANPASIEEAAKVLDVPQEDFESFLALMDCTYDDYIERLSQHSKTLKDEKKSLEERYDCTYGEYVETILTVCNNIVPDNKDYAVFKSKFSVCDTYIPYSELNKAGDMLSNMGIGIEIADEASDAYIFDVIGACNGDFATYMSAVNNYSGCTSLSLTNITLFGNYGVKKPETDNACMDKLFCYDDKTDDILEAIVVPVITLHYDDENEKMLKLSSFDFQVRLSDAMADNMKNSIIL